MLERSISGSGPGGLAGPGFFAAQRSLRESLSMVVLFCHRWPCCAPALLGMLPREVKSRWARAWHGSAASPLRNSMAREVPVCNGWTRGVGPHALPQNVATCCTWCCRQTRCPGGAGPSAAEDCFTIVAVLQCHDQLVMPKGALISSMVPQWCSVSARCLCVGSVTQSVL